MKKVMASAALNKNISMIGKRVPRLWPAALLVILLAASPVKAYPLQETGTEETGKDIVHLVNGDRLSGEITRLENGVLYIDTELAGSVELKWANVERLEGATPLLVTLEEQGKIQGILAKDEDSEVDLIVDTGAEKIEIQSAGPVLAESLDQPPVDRFKGGVNFGLTVLKAKDTRQFSLGLSSSYAADTYYAEASYTTFYTTDNASGQNYRDFLNTTYQREISGGWFFTGMFNAARNDALQLDLRYNLNGALGKDIINKDNAVLQALAGFGYVSENYEDGFERSAGEAVFGLKLKTLELESPRLSLTAEAFLYPRPEDLDVYRIEAKTGLNLNLVRNVFWGLSFFDSYTSEPAITGGVKNDYGMVSSLGVSW